ncbi:MAG: glycine cleavage system protein T, partial [Syntrophobacteraceae bacterium]
MEELYKTVLNDTHKALGAQMVEFGGWEMPLQYPSGVIEEHLATRREAGIFDVSHMGRFVIRGPNALPFLQHVLTNNAEALDLMPTGAQYTIIADEAGDAIDDAYLYRFFEGEYLLVVNASNRLKDWAHLRERLAKFDGVELVDRTEETAMIALQGPLSRKIMSEIVEAGRLPEPFRNAVGIVWIAGAQVLVGRTGYTGEPLCFELFLDREYACTLWELLAAKGAKPTGLAARDTLRLEAVLPLYGHEFGKDPEGGEIPVYAVPLGKFAVSFSPLKGDFIGRAALEKQFAAYKKILTRDY